MNKQNLWVVVVVTVGWIGFMLGFSMSAQTGAKPVPAAAPAAAGGYGGAKPAAAGYGGGVKPVVGGKGH